MPKILSITLVACALPGLSTGAARGRGVKYDAEATGYGWKTDLRIEAKDTAMPTTCRMQRP